MPHSFSALETEMTPAEELRQQIAEIEAAQATLDPRTTQFIVMMGEMPLQFVNSRPLPDCLPKQPSRFVRLH